jgi:Matrixin
VNKIVAASAVFASVLASSLFGSGGTTTADAAVSSYSWPKDVVYVYDTTSRLKKTDGSPVWAVNAAAARWAGNNPVDFRYTTHGCPSGSQCVTVRQSELASPAVGVTSIGRVGASIRSVTIVLDTTFGRTNSSARRRNVVCHELGHALGLKHRTATTSCLTSYVTAQKYPDATDIKNLNTMYGNR